MERNSSFTKERALFYYEKVERYFKQHAYAQALSEIEHNRDLFGAILNIGKQLSLNKIYAQCVVNTMLDFYEVDGDITSFNSSYSTYRTMLEIHTSKDVYDLLSKYYTDGEKNENLKTKSKKLNVDVPTDYTEYVEPVSADTISFKSSGRTVNSDEIAKDFLDSIGTPLFAAKDLQETVNKEAKDTYGARKSDFDYYVENGSQKTGSISDTIEIRNKKPISLESTQKFETAKVREVTKNTENIIATESVKQKRNEYLKDLDSIPKLDLDFGNSDINNNSEALKRKPSNPPKEIHIDIPPTTASQAKEVVAKQNKPKSNNNKSAKSNSKKSQKNSKGNSKNKKHSKMPVLLIILLFAIISGAYFAYVNGIFDSLIKIPTIDSSEQNQVPEAEPNQVVPDEIPAIEEPEPTVTEPETNTPDSEYILPSNTVILTNADLVGLDKKTVRLAINEIYARNGWGFEFGGTNYEYFKSKSWYSPDPNMTNSSEAAAKFNDTERRNLATLLDYEKTLN